MAMWLILILAALVLAVIGATTAAAWLLVVGIALLVVGLLWAVASRGGRSRAGRTGGAATARDPR